MAASLAHGYHFLSQSNYNFNGSRIFMTPNRSQEELEEACFRLIKQYAKYILKI